MLLETRSPFVRAAGAAPRRAASIAAFSSLLLGLSLGAPVFAADPASAAAELERAVALARARPAPEGELFALVRLRHRATGAEAAFTRGEADPTLGEKLHGAEAERFADSVTVVAEGGVEIVTRSIVLRPAPEPGEEAQSAAEPDDDEAALRARNAGTGLSFRIESGLRAQLERLGVAPGDPAPAPATAGAESPTLPVMISLFWWMFRGSG